ncbi:MAG: endo alpha-1,4 polygalactosaminidase [bacterium]
MLKKILVLLAFASLFAPVSADTDSNRQRLHDAGSFSLALGADPSRQSARERLAAYDLVVVDGGDTTQSELTALRAAGTLTLGYLSVGTIEPWRPWYQSLKPYRLDRYEDWGEYYARVNNRKYRSVIVGRIARAVLSKGFDGLFLDNTDMVANHRDQQRGMHLMVRALARLVHRRGKVLMAQNGASTIKPILRYLDGWNREDVTWTWSFREKRYTPVSAAERLVASRQLRRLSRAGLAVFATDYAEAGNQAAVEDSRLRACAAGAIPFVSSIRLIRIPLPPLTCSAD